MAGVESSPPPQPHQSLEENIAGLTLQEKVEALVEDAKEYLVDTKQPADTSAGEAQGKSEEYEEKIYDAVSEKTSEKAEKDDIIKETAYEKEATVAEEVPSREVQIAKEEVAESSDEGAYAVPTVDHRSYAEPEGKEKKEDIPTAIVHENADGKEQRSKGILQSVTGKLSQSVQSVKSVFSGITGSKSSKNSDPKSSGIEEPKTSSSYDQP